jgi:hypothetical protein
MGCKLQTQFWGSGLVCSRYVPSLKFGVQGPVQAFPDFYDGLESLTESRKMKKRMKNGLNNRKDGNSATSRRNPQFNR